MAEEFDLGPQYAKDDPFKADARYHQSKFRLDHLKVGYQDYGNRLKDEDARELLNYMPFHGVHEAVRERYPKYSRPRDADMLRSEHVPFNFFGPMCTRPKYAKEFLERCLYAKVKKVLDVRIEFAPSPKERYLDDATSFDTYIDYINIADEHIGVGIEVKFTEGPYPIGKTERGRVEDSDSIYWQITRNSDEFSDPTHPGLVHDGYRQFWRNHLLGIAMVQRGEIDRFCSVTIYPADNRHCAEAVPDYRTFLNQRGRDRVFGVTFEEFIAVIFSLPDASYWGEYLRDRYLVPVRTIIVE